MMQAYTQETLETLRARIFMLPAGDSEALDALALDIFRFQAAHNPVYRTYLKHLGTRVEKIQRLEAIPFLPISFFRTHVVKTGDWMPKHVFRSSGTTRARRSQHMLAAPEFYRRVAREIFMQYGGIPEESRLYPNTQVHLLALLPSHLERGDSSLVYMVRALIEDMGSSHSGFFSHADEALFARIASLKEREGIKILFGLRVALLDLADRLRSACPDLSDLVLIETGGMKQREDKRSTHAVHAYLSERLRPRALHAEYGMTELLSHAYARKAGAFQPPPWMWVRARALDDPFAYLPSGQVGGLNIADLAAVHACSFVETEDRGRALSSGHFEVLGRLDGAVPRGCHHLFEA